jgi:methionyl-tRNA synthetase
MKKIGFTTPAFYASGQPHIGHLYSVLIAKILTHYHRSNGFDVFFQSGMDEHGEKIEQKAKKANLSPEEFVETMYQVWTSFYESLDVEFDEMIRTSKDLVHKKFVQTLLKQAYDKGDIYLAEHKGFYCIECEAYLTSEQMDQNGHCLIHKIPTEERSEANYYFKLSRYHKELETLYQKDSFVKPNRYRSELLGLLKQDLGDFSLSRPKSRTQWGIEIPFDPEHVTYVWFDALPNYLSAHLKHKNLQPAQLKDLEIWQNTYHVIGKDILKFHGVYWPAMLLSADLPIPKLLITGWILVDEHKVSKSLGNLVDFNFFGRRSLDALISYLFTRSVGDDIEFSEKDLKDHYQTFLANQIGNLHSRILKMVEQYTQGKLIKRHAPPTLWAIHEDDYHRAFQNLNLSKALLSCYKLGKEIDQYLSKRMPWSLWKKGQKNDTFDVLETCCHGLQTLHRMLKPFWPKTCEEMQKDLQENETEFLCQKKETIFPKYENSSTSR